MTDRLMKLYELNEQYHDTKEKRAWLATTFYAGFSLAVFKWATTTENMVFLQKHQGYQIPILAFLMVIALSVLFFNCFQYRKKRASVKIENFISTELSSSNGDDHDQLARVFDYMRKVNRPFWKRNKNKHQRYISTEIEIFALMGALLFAQVLVILTASGTFHLKWLAV